MSLTAPHINKYLHEFLISILKTRNSLRIIRTREIIRKENNSKNNTAGEVIQKIINLLYSLYTLRYKNNLKLIYTCGLK